MPMTLLFFAVWIVLISGCASNPFRKADCLRYRYGDYNILACNDDAVNHNCHKYVKHWDNGKPMDDGFIRACYKPNKWGRRPNILIGKSYINCLPHELCHLEALDARICEKKYPCIGDK